MGFAIKPSNARAATCVAALCFSKLRGRASSYSDISGWFIVAAVKQGGSGNKPLLPLKKMKSSRTDAFLRGAFTRSELEFLRRCGAFERALAAWDGKSESFDEVVRIGCELLVRAFVPARRGQPRSTPVTHVHSPTHTTSVPPPEPCGGAILSFKAATAVCFWLNLHARS